MTSAPGAGPCTGVRSTSRRIGPKTERHFSHAARWVPLWYQLTTISIIRFDSANCWRELLKSLSIFVDTFGTITTHFPSRCYVPRLIGRHRVNEIYVIGGNNMVEAMHRIRQSKSPLLMSLMMELQQFLTTHNSYAKFYCNVQSHLHKAPHSEFVLKQVIPAGFNRKIYNKPSVDEVAMVVESSNDASIGPRDILLQKADGEPVKITNQHSGYLALRYPILFPYGQPNWVKDVASSNGRRRNITQAKWYAGMVFEKKDQFSAVHRAKSLFQELLLDLFMCVNQPRLDWFQIHQKEIKAELYQGVEESICDDVDATGTRIILPLSYIGSPRSMVQLYQDSMSIVSKFGRPSLFITMTANPAWPEIRDNLKPGQVVSDRPDLCVRAFRQHCNNLVEDVTKKHVLGKVVAHVSTIEFQKRGLPHCHLMCIMAPGSVLLTPECVDCVISAEILDPIKEPLAHSRVVSHMIHSCGPTTGCWEDGKCTKHFPKPYQNSTTMVKDSYPLYRRRSSGPTVTKAGRQLSNESVIPYNKFLLMKYNCHINVEVPYGINATKYLFKHITKGSDRAAMRLVNDFNNEILKYINGRYIGPCKG
ncbi:hypothetical protein PCASD_08098 [Puccinia coronata f. sp. avenae]|uniref:Helitron helicase-like domain-containing protein n=1 Tax=Puccinia coronata f. sp. avenae TaxID=200324 RepID=A0A2N5VAB4_9BASI|nr:hypothetical protein PCASD_08098 [Puccinia coronata f. sp. avenae]